MFSTRTQHPYTVFSIDFSALADPLREDCIYGVISDMDCLSSQVGVLVSYLLSAELGWFRILFNRVKFCRWYHPSIGNAFTSR